MSQVVILAIALHVLVFGNSELWRTQGGELGFLTWKARLVRDVLVLGCLWTRSFNSGSKATSALFRRLGIFYLAYSLVDVAYLYGEAAWDVRPGTWLDLLWTLPRVIAVIAALSWTGKDTVEIEFPRLRHQRRLEP